MDRAKETNLTKQEAIEALKEGYGIRYKTWWWGRHVYRDENYRGEFLLDDKGKRFTFEDILTANEGWEVYKSEQHGEQNEPKGSGPGR